MNVIRISPRPRLGTARNFGFMLLGLVVALSSGCATLGARSAPAEPVELPSRGIDVLPGSFRQRLALEARARAEAERDRATDSYADVAAKDEFDAAIDALIEGFDLLDSGRYVESQARFESAACAFLAARERTARSHGAIVVGLRRILGELE
jgi:hypothetical protein